MDTSRFKSQLLLFTLTTLGHVLTPDVMSFGLGVAVWTQQPDGHWTNTSSHKWLPRSRESEAVSSVLPECGRTSAPRRPRSHHLTVQTYGWLSQQAAAARGTGLPLCPRRSPDAGATAPSRALTSSLERLAARVLRCLACCLMLSSV